MSLSEQIWTVSFFIFLVRCAGLSSKSFTFWGMKEKDMGREGGRIEILDAGSQNQAVITVLLITE